MTRSGAYPSTSSSDRTDELSLASSPWSNTYDPPLDDGTLPSDKLRELESKLGEAFEVYREM